ncbi:MAG: hypothetical protein KKD86_19850, partial [Bacteroidetes bacterium]|nr:hypothetical protein [Bacteroidota bacterium]
MEQAMKTTITLLIVLISLIDMHNITAQDIIVHPSVIKKPVGFAISGPLRNNPVVSYSDFEAKEIPINRKINPNIQPPDFSKILLDPGEQTQFGLITGNLVNNYAGQNTNYYPPDANGDVGSLYYFQAVNTTYTIYRKSDGSIVAGPSALNTLFNPSLPGVQYNDGDPIILWDEHADRWLFTEFSVDGSNDYMLIAISTTDDPTGTWYSWSFDVDDKPDYPKFGIWKDGYYMATNTPLGNDVYVFDRTAMIEGDSNSTMIGFDNPNRPSTFDEFHCILPLDNDGAWAPTGEPGQFITIADDDQQNPNDALYIYELDVDWAEPSNSTFTRTQTINVNSFSGDFNGTWNNILQPGTSQKLDALSTILMHRAQYRNFNGTQKIVCTHTIAESSTEAAIRWYELENTGSGWSIAQQGTYNPDNVSRWCASIAMNDVGEIAMGYSVSDGSSTYPGIRFCGQSNSAQPGIMDIAETTIWTGSYSQLPVPGESSGNRWGDYANISIDPSDGKTFWFTTEYKESATHTKGTRIAAISSFNYVIIDQQLQNGASTDSVALWEGGTHFQKYPVPHPSDFTIGSEFVLRGAQKIISDQKFNNWSKDDTVKNHRVFLKTEDFPGILTSKFNPIYFGITIKNNIEMIDYDPTNDSILFKDPWLIDYPDPNFGNNIRNRGMDNAGPDKLEFKSRPSPFYPDYSTSYSGDVYQGVFLEQGYSDPNKPYYTVKAISPQPITINGRDHTFYFQNWSVSGAAVQNANSSSTPVVFTSGNATVTANLKGTQLSSQTDAFLTNSQRKFVRTDDGDLHLVYSSMGKVWYEISTNNGITWQIANGGQPLSGSNKGKLPAIDYRGDFVVIVWQEEDVGAYDIKMAKFIAGNYMYGDTIFMDIDLPYSSNTNPVVSWDGEGRILVMWKRDEDNVGDWPIGIVFSYGSLNSFGWNEMDFGLIPNTNSNSINPTLATDKTYSIPSTYHLAWEQTSGSYSYIKYFELYRDGRDGYQKIQTRTSSPETPSSGGGFWTNRKPSIIALDNNTPRLAWIG